MEMCPYCGEDVPDDAPHCWKCGGEIVEGEGGGGAGPEAEQELPSVPSPADRVECPSCGAPGDPRAGRCTECGRPLTVERPARSGALAVYGAFALVLLGLALWLGYASLRRAIDPVSFHAQPLQLGYRDLVRLYDGSSDPRLQVLWRDQHRGRYVRWELFLLGVREDGALALGTSTEVDPAEPEVVLALTDPAQAVALPASEPLAFSGVLERYEGKTFFLRDGQVERP